MFTEKEYYDEAMKIGVKGYVLKENSRRDLVTAFSFASHVMNYVSPVILKHLGTGLRHMALSANIDALDIPPFPHQAFIASLSRLNLQSK